MYISVRGPSDTKLIKTVCNVVVTGKKGNFPINSIATLDHICLMLFIPLLITTNTS
jgi:hypothetical protein